MIITIIEIRENPTHHFLSFLKNKYIVVQIKVCSSKFRVK